jgi:two-component system, sensor histidine kinase and response regulator
MIVDWFNQLFEATGFLTYNHFGRWSDALVRAYIASNALITLAYLLIPVCLLIVWHKRRHDIEYAWLLLLFVAFITACGLTHLCDIVVFWWPAYRLFTLISSVAALLSVYTAVWLPSLTAAIGRLPTPAMYQKINQELEQAVALTEQVSNESKAAIAALNRQVNHLERMRQTGLWVAEQESALHDLKTVLDSANANEVAI